MSSGFGKPCRRCKTKFATCPGVDNCRKWSHWIEELRERGDAVVEQARREKAAKPL